MILKNLLLKKSFLRLPLFMLAFSSVFSTCPGGGSVNNAIYVYCKDANGKEALATTFFLGASGGMRGRYDAPVGKKISKVTLFVKEETEGQDIHPGTEEQLYVKVFVYFDSNSYSTLVDCILNSSTKICRAPSGGANFVELQ